MKPFTQTSATLKPVVLMIVSVIIVFQVLSFNPFQKYMNQDKYKELWAKVEKFEKEGLPKSALEVVEQILTMARSEKNSPQIFKAFVHKMKFEIQTIDNGHQHVLNALRAEAQQAVMPEKAILESLYAEILLNYYMQNRWQIMNRTYTGEFVPEDIATWDARRLNDEVAAYYLKSLDNIEQLKKQPLDNLQEILIHFDKSWKLRKNLFDLLAHRALTFFSGNDANLTDLSNTFHIDQPEYFSPARQFALMNIQTNDRSARKYNVLSIYQNLIRIHLEDSSPESLIDVDLLRLKYVRNNAVLPNADTLYFKALMEMHDRFGSYEAVAAIDFEIASFLKKRGETYNHFTNPEVKNDIANAYHICKTTAEKFPKAPYTANLKELMKEIETKTFGIKTEKNLYPGSFALMQVSYKNIEKLHFKVIDVSSVNIKEKTDGRRDSLRLAFFNSLPVFRTFETNFVNENDYQNHTTELILDPLPTGKYLIMASPDKSFRYLKNKVDYLFLNITTLSYVYQQREDYSYVFHVMDRENGTPLSGVKAEAWYDEYNYSRGQNETKKLGTWTTDVNGEITIPPGRRYRNVFIDFSKGNDKLSSEIGFYQYEPYDTKPRMTTKTTFFTDRSIYRPGQTLYFKGIMYDTDGEQSKIKINVPTTVILYDANYQKVSELSLQTNEFGSFQGEFVLPEGGITGQMYITNSYGNQYFRMEEYKRPKFEVKFEKIDKYFRLNEKVEVSGNAQAYAGYAIDGAKVSYTVTRSTYFPYRYSWWWYPPAPAATVMKQGELITGEDGKFMIDFHAEPEPTVQKKYLPAFIFTVQADVTDINGETRSSSTTVYVGYKSMILSADIGEYLNSAKVDSVRITTANLSGNDVPAKGKMTITKVEANSYKISRPWEKPDRPLVTKDEFLSKLPLLAWDDEDKPSSWKRGKQVFSTAFDTELNKKVPLEGAKNWSPGWYHVVLTSVDPFGETVEYEHYFKVYSTKSSKQNFEEPFWAIPEKVQGEPGETAMLIIGSDAPKAKVLVCVEHKGKIVDKKLHQVGGSLKLLEFPILSIHRGNFSIHLAMVHHNRVFTRSFTVNVPHTDKQLDIRFETFRDKLLPGQEEEWRLVISGAKGEKALAELAAVLYDASLDAFASHYWSMFLGRYDYASMYFNNDNNFGQHSSSSFADNWYWFSKFSFPVYEFLNTYGLTNFFGYYRYGYYDYDELIDFDGGLEQSGRGVVTLMAVDGVKTSTGRSSDRREDAPASEEKSAGQTKNIQTISDVPVTGELEEDHDGKDVGQFKEIELRTNFQETAFFYPQLRTNEKGEVVIAFTVPESLTRWKMMGFAHTTDLKTGQITKELVTKKDLMVMPNLPRFFRENDTLFIAAKISNLTDVTQNGKATLQLFNAETMQTVDLLMGNTASEVNFSAPAQQSVSVTWKITVPSDIAAVTCRIIASTAQHSDGEEHTLPVLVNKMLVTESMPLPVRSKQKKVFRHEKLLNAGKSSTLRHHSLTLEFTANPAWYAVQALPYMMEFPYECAEQVFARYYSNILATHIVNSKPDIKKVFDEWSKYPDSDALLSNLEKNQELKALVLEETPWVREARNETERKRRVALLFDLNKMSKETDRALRKLKKMQKPGGGWVWFEGFPPDRYITQHIISGFGHLDHLNVMRVKDKRDVWNMVADGISFIDREIVVEYQYLKKWYTPEQMKEDRLSYMAVHYLYTRSFFNEYVSIPKATQEAYDYFLGQAQQYWLNKGLYSQGMIALALHRKGDKATPAKIIKSLDERSIKNEEMGMFWQQNIAGYSWWQAPIETHALLIEAFHEIADNTQTVDDLKTWLLKQKQVQDWKTTKATTEAVYVLLLTGTDWLATEADIEIIVGDEVFDLKKQTNIEAGTGYFKTNWNSGQISPSMGRVQVTKRDEGVSWGALYWQYFEQLDKITPHETPLKLKKKLFIERMTPKGKQLEELKEGNTLKIGDKVIVRIELRVDRDMEYVHMKDMRASGFEPMNVLSQYKWQDGLGYYESTRDAATNFFMNRLNKGTYVFEYPLRASIAGNFSNGITTIQCMYAPEFTSHSEGIRLRIQP
jgi:uncharacterized protein YfaS (alpha-2-macroglobulin family)